MENEYRERSEAEEQMKNTKRSSSGPDPREILEGLQGNVYVEKDKESESSGKKNAKRRTGNEKKTGGNSRATRAKRPNLLVQVLNGDILTRDFVLNNLSFIFFFLFLLLLVVAKGYYGKQLTKDIDALQTEVNASTAEYIENKAKLEEMTTRYRLVEALERRGLKETVKPAKVIRIKREEK